MNGKQVSLPLRFRPTGRTGVLEIERPDLPSGVWLLSVSARLDRVVSSEMAPLDAHYRISPLADREKSGKPGKYAGRVVPARDIQETLASLAR